MDALISDYFTTPILSEERAAVARTTNTLYAGRSGVRIPVRTLDCFLLQIVQRR
jgi:hypothetical protein